MSTAVREQQLSALVRESLRKRLGSEEFWALGENGRYGVATKKLADAVAEDLERDGVVVSTRADVGVPA